MSDTPETKRQSAPEAWRAPGSSPATPVSAQQTASSTPPPKGGGLIGVTPTTAPPKLGPTGGGQGGGQGGGSTGTKQPVTNRGNATAAELAKITEVVNAVGLTDPDDEEPDPERDADFLETRGKVLAPLVNVLRDAPVLDEYDVYRRADFDADQHEERFRFMGGWAARLVAISVLLGAVQVLIATGWSPVRATFGGAMSQWVLALQFLAVIAALIFAFVIHRYQLRESWLYNRAEAETSRLRLFETVFDFKSKAATDPNLLLKTEYFRRFYLEAERNLAMKACCNIEFDWGSRRGLIVLRFALLVGLILLAFVAWIALFRSGASGAGRELSALSTAACLAAAGVGGWLFGLMTFKDHRFDAARFSHLARKLHALTGEPLYDVRLAAVRGDKKAVEAYLKSVSDITAMEHRQWLTLRQAQGKVTLAEVIEENL